MRNSLLHNFHVKKISSNQSSKDVEAIKEALQRGPPAAALQKYAKNH